MRAQAQPDEAVQAARQRRELWENHSGEQNNPNEHYEAACDLALCVLIARDEAGWKSCASVGLELRRVDPPG
jgi:hypothetical protein